MLERILVLAVMFVMFGIPAGITWLKGHHGAFILGFVLLGMIWMIAALRLARPSSWWARRFYGPEKMQRALKRFGAEASTTA